MGCGGVEGVGRGLTAFHDLGAIELRAGNRISLRRIQGIKVLVQCL